MCTYLNGLGMTGVTMYVMHKRLNDNMGTGYWCLLYNQPAAARMLGRKAALHAAAEEAATGVSGNTPHCFLPVDALHTNLNAKP